MSRAAKFLFLRTNQLASILETEEWLECPAGWKKDSWEEKTEIIFLASSETQNQRKPVVQLWNKKLNKLKR